MALSFTEKRALQRTVSDNLAALAEGKATFSEKRALQKAISEAMTKLGSNGGTVDMAARDEQLKKDTFAALVALGWKQAAADGGAPSKEIGGGFKGEINPEGLRNLRAEIRAGLLMAMFGDKALATVGFAISATGAENAKALDDAVRALDVQPPKTKADLDKVMPLLQNFIGSSQMSVVKSALRGEESQFFIDKMLEIANTIQTMPHTYQTDGQGDNALAYLHYFKGSSDWYIIEKDKGGPDDETPGVQSQAFGYVVLNGDKINAESGYISIEELIGLNVELDFYWSPKTLAALKGKDDKPKGAGAPTVAEVGAALVERGWTSQMDGVWKLDPELTPSFKGTGIYMASGTDAGGGNSGWILVDVWDENAFVPLGGSFSLTGNTASDIVNGIDRMIAEHEFSAGTGNKKLADLIAGSYYDLEPLAFLGVLKDISMEINDIEPLKAPAITYIEKNADKVTAVMESAFQEAFGKIWGHASPVLESAGGFPALADWQRSGNMLSVEVGKAKYSSVKTAGGDSFTLTVDAEGKRKNIYIDNDPEKGWFKTANDAVKAAKQYHQMHFAGA